MVLAKIMHLASEIQKNVSRRKERFIIVSTINEGAKDSPGPTRLILPDSAKDAECLCATNALYR